MESPEPVNLVTPPKTTWINNIIIPIRTQIATALEGFFIAAKLSQTQQDACAMYVNNLSLHDICCNTTFGKIL